MISEEEIILASQCLEIRDLYPQKLSHNRCRNLINSTGVKIDCLNNYGT